MNYLRIIIALLSIGVSIGHAAEFSVENQFLRRTVAVENDRLFTKEIENKVAGTMVRPTSCDEFRLRLSEGTHVTGTDVVLTSADFKARPIRFAGGLAFALENKKYGLTIEVRYELKPEDFYTRKRLVIRSEKPVTLERIDVEAISLADANQPYTIKAINSRGKWSPGLGQPLYTTRSATFWGIEFPAAYNYVEGESMFAGYLWGFELKPGIAYHTWPSVIGVADDPEFNQEAFFHYIDRVRARPLRLQTQYNSWFNGGGSVSRERFKESIETIHRELVLERGSRPLSAYVIDSGWQTKHDDWTDKTWKVNDKFDIDFFSSRANAAKAGSRLGLWMSPGCNFGARWAVPFYREKGFEALDNYMSLAGPKYMQLFEDRMVELAELGIAYFKLDGLFGHLNTRDFELNGNRYGIPYMPQLGTEGIGSADPILNEAKYDELKTYYLAAGTERMMRIFKKLGEINPDVYIVISNGAYLSPWWLMYIDAVWMINAGDAARGADRTGELVYRDGVYHEIWKVENTQYPMHSLFNHEPKKRSSGESKKAFRDYLYMNLSRGTGFVELYITPGNLQEPDWDVLAEGFHWVDDVFPLFARCRMHGGNPRKGEVYGYTAWNRTRGYVSIHNPSDEERIYSITLDRRFGLIPDSGPFQLSSPIAESTAGLKVEHHYGDTIGIKLKRREIRILNFDPAPRDWKIQRELQRRNPDPDPGPVTDAKLKTAAAEKSKTVPPSEFVGVWTYRFRGQVCSREFTKDGMCILKRGGKVDWEKPVTGHEGKTVVVDGRYKHQLTNNNEMRIEGRYTATREGSDK